MPEKKKIELTEEELKKAAGGLSYSGTPSTDPTGFGQESGGNQSCPGTSELGPRGDDPQQVPESATDIDQL